MLRGGDRPSGSDPAVRLAELLRDDGRQLPDPRFRAALRERLVSAPPVAPATGGTTLSPAFLGLAAAVAGLALIAALLRQGAGPADRLPVATAPSPEPIATSDPGFGGDRSLTGSHDGPTTPDLPPPTARPSQEPSRRAPTERTAGGRALPTAAAAALSVDRTADAGRGEPLRPSDTPSGDAPEYTPRPATPASSPTHTLAPDEPTETATALGGLPPTPSPAPTGQGWPTLPAPPAPDAGQAGP